MSERRSMAAAMTPLSADKMAFIKSGPVGDAAPIPATPAIAEESLPSSNSPEEGPSDRQAPKRSRSRRGAMELPSATDEIPQAMIARLVSLTTRLQPETFVALKRAGFEQKLYGREPGTVQEIAELAIRHWLTEAGYLK